MAVRWTRTRPSRKRPDLFALAFPSAAASDRPTEATVDADHLVRTLFTQEGAALVRLARLFTDDRNAAEDLVQEAFIRLHRSADRIRDPDRAAPYLRSILLNLARDHIAGASCRSATRRRSHRPPLPKPPRTA